MSCSGLAVRESCPQSAPRCPCLAWAPLSPCTQARKTCSAFLWVLCPGEAGAAFPVCHLGAPPSLQEGAGYPTLQLVAKWLRPLLLPGRPSTPCVPLAGPSYPRGPPPSLSALPMAPWPGTYQMFFIYYHDLKRSFLWPASGHGDRNSRASFCPQVAHGLGRAAAQEGKQSEPGRGGEGHVPQAGFLEKVRDLGPGRVGSSQARRAGGLCSSQKEMRCVPLRFGEPPREPVCSGLGDWACGAFPGRCPPHGSRSRGDSTWTEIVRAGLRGGPRPLTAEHRPSCPPSSPTWTPRATPWAWCR